MIAWVIPFLIYAALYRIFGLDVSGIGFWVVLGAVVVTALTVYAEALLALHRVTPPPATPRCTRARRQSWSPTCRTRRALWSRP